MIFRAAFRRGFERHHAACRDDISLQNDDITDFVFQTDDAFAHASFVLLVYIASQVNVYFSPIPPMFDIHWRPLNDAFSFDD